MVVRRQRVIYDFKEVQRVGCRMNEGLNRATGYAVSWRVDAGCGDTVFGHAGGVG
jgi:hypothetical protein